MVPRPLAWLLPALLSLAGAAHAAEGPAVRTPRVTATLVTDTDAVAPGQPFRAALRLRLAPGWHVYWRNPGAAGQETQVALDLPGGAVAGPVAWPAPRRFDEAGIVVYGYTGEVVLPMDVTPGAHEGGPFHVGAKANWLVCAAVCVPEEASLSLDLPWGTPTPSAEAPLVARALDGVPRPAPFPVTLDPSGLLTLDTDPAQVRIATFFPDEADTIVDGAAQPLGTRDGHLTLRLTPGPQFRPAALTGVVVLNGGERALAVSPSAVPAPVPDAAPTPVPAPVQGSGMGATLLLAFAGGLLLNLMPCVFPLLAMKAAGLARMAGAGRRAVRREALAYTGGVLATFCGLGAALAGAAGWGAQFQSPAFVAGMAWLMFGVGLNLSGVFGVGGRLAGAGSGWAGRAGPAGAFATGALAVLVAAPCTAPFMGTAIATALTLPPAGALAVFATMGAGLAAPTLVLAGWPGLAGVLPRPGRWMEVLRGALAFPMYAAAAWLVWVVGVQAGLPGVLVAASGLVLVGFAGWVWQVAEGSVRLGRPIGRLCAAVALAGAVALLPSLEAAAPSVAAPVAGTEPFSATRLAALRAEGRPVFVDMTAAWCIPCLVNERVALAPTPVRQAFADRHVAVLRGDWTRRDPEITAYLRSQGRDGVPLYVFYPPGGTGIVLPQLLTAGTVLDHIARGNGDG